MIHVLLKIVVLGSVHTTLKKFENASKVFRPHYGEEVENATIISHFGFVFEENSGREITWLS